MIYIYIYIYVDLNGDQALSAQYEVGLAMAQTASPRLLTEVAGFDSEPIYL